MGVGVGVAGWDGCGIVGQSVGTGTVGVDGAVVDGAVPLQATPLRANAAGAVLEPV